MVEAPTHAPMGLGDYLRILRRRAWVIVVVTALAVGVAIAWSSKQDKTFTASGEVVVAQGTGEVDTATQAKIMESQVVHQLALQKLPSAVDVAATADSDGGGITITADSAEPQTAAASVNAHMDAYVEFLRKQALDSYTAVAAQLQPQIDALQPRIDALDAQIQLGDSSAKTRNERTLLAGKQAAFEEKLTQLQLDVPSAGDGVQVLRRAIPPATAATVSLRESVLVGLGAGLLFGVLAALLMEFLDDSIRTRQDLLGASGGDVPVLGVIPASRSARTAVVSLTEPDSPVAEAYRSLRTAVHFVGSDRSQCVAITAPRLRNGKTETVANLAVLAARTGQRVVVVDGDMRYPPRSRVLQSAQRRRLHVSRVRNTALGSAQAGAGN